MINKIKAFKKRNPDRFISSLFRDFSARLYTKPLVRKLISGLFKKKEPEKWVFLVGCYNSGTTILREILGAHSEISSLPREGVRFTSEFPFMEEGGWKRMWVMNNYSSYPPVKNGNTSLEKIKKHWNPWWENGSMCFLEKSITHTTRIKWLEDNFDNAYFIFIQRNGYCVSEGIRRRAVPNGVAAEKIGNEYPIGMPAEQWKVANEYVIRDKDYVKNSISVSYEQLVEDSFATVKSIIEFLGVDVNCLEASDNGIMVNERHFLIKNMNSRSISKLSQEDIKVINQVSGELMMQLGYDLIDIPQKG